VSLVQYCSTVYQRKDCRTLPFPPSLFYSIPGQRKRCGEEQRPVTVNIYSYFSSFVASVYLLWGTCGTWAFGGALGLNNAAELSFATRPMVENLITLYPNLNLKIQFTHFLSARLPFAVLGYLEMSRVKVKYSEALLENLVPLYRRFSFLV
jgi:hypothetical protein